MKFADSLKCNTAFQLTKTTRFISSDSSTCTEDKKEYQRLKDEEVEYETKIKHDILNAGLHYVDASGWSKQALAEGIITIRSSFFV